MQSKTMWSHISQEKTMYEMWDALTNLYQSSNENKMALKEKLKSIKMT